MAQFSDQDYNLLSSYLDGRLDDTERATFEARLAADFALRAELDALRETVGLLKMAQRVPVPRSFTLDPAVYAKPARRSFLDTLGLGAMPGWAMAGASLVVVALCIGIFILRGSTGGAATSVAQAPQAAMLAAATEASAGEAATEAATEAPAGTIDTFMFSAQASPEGAQPNVLPPAGTSAKSGQMTEVGGMAGGGPGSAGETTGAGGFGGGPSTVSGGGGAVPSQPPEPTLAPFAQSLPAPSTESAADAQANNGVNPQGNADSASVRSAAGLAETASPSPAPYSTIFVTEADPTKNLKPFGWAILVGVTILLIVGVLAAGLLFRRRK